MMSKAINARLTRALVQSPLGRRYPLWSILPLKMSSTATCVKRRAWCRHFSRASLGRITMKNSNLHNRSLARGGGPITPAGKLSSSRNSTKHGIYSPTVVLPGESEFEFNVLKQQLIDEYSPRGTTQLTLVNDLAVLIWKKRRLEYLEGRMIASRIADPICSEELQDELMFYFPKDHEWILDLLSALTGEFAQTHQQRYNYALSMRKRIQMLEATDLDRMKTECPSLEDFIQYRAEYRCLLPRFRTLEGLISATVSFSGKDEDDQSFLRMELSGAMEESRQILWGYEHLAEIERGIEKIRDKRHMQMNYRSNTHRLFEELSKSISKTCSELSKLQQIYQGSSSQELIHPNEQIATSVGALGLVGDGALLGGVGGDDELLNLQQVSSSTKLREENLEADELKRLIYFNKNCEHALHLESLRNRRLFKMPVFTKQTRSY